MKRNIIFLLMVIFVLSLVACEAPKDKTGSKVTYDIVGTKDFYVQINDTQVDFLEGVTAEGSDDSINAPQVDSSNIDFTKAGKYELVYSYKEAPVVTCYVYVYDEPEFVIAEGSEVLTLEYDEVSNSLLNGITAKDSFDNALEVVIVDYKGLFNGDGSANYGSFDIVYSAEDRVGNVAIQERKVVVTENTEAAPQILNSENLLFDVVDENITLEIDIKLSSQVLISIDANIVEYEIVENNYVIDTTVLFSDLSLSDHVIRVVTEKGYDEAAFTLVDNQEPIYNAEGLNNWYFEVNKAGVLPVVEKANANQRYELFYSLKDANNNLISIENNEFVPETVGEYTYTIDFKREDSIVKTESFTYTVYDSETYEKIVDLANSKQFLGATIVPMGGKVKVDFFADSIGGRENVYKITMAQSTPISEWYDRIEVKNIKEKAEVYYSLNFDMYFEGNVTPRFGIKGGDSFWLHETGSQGVVNMYLNGAKTTSIPNQQWFTVEIVVSQVDITKATVEALTMMFGDNDAGTIAYLSNMRFIDFSEYVADFTGFNNWIFKAEEENALPSFNRVQGAQHTYEFTSVPEGATNPGILNTANFNFATPGEYEYTYTVSYAGNAYSKNLSLTVYSAEDYNKIADSANSMQFFKQNLVIGSGGMKLDYHDEAIGGRQGAYKVTIAPGATTANQWYNRIEYNKENTEFKEKMTTYPILSMDFYLEQGADIGFIIKGSPTLKFTDSRIKLFVDGEMVSAIPYGKWFTAEITISSFTSEYNTSPLNIVCASANKVFYINDVVMLTQEESLMNQQ